MLGAVKNDGGRNLREALIAEDLSQLNAWSSLRDTS
jgi:hypothetical protein